MYRSFWILSLLTFGYQLSWESWPASAAAVPACPHPKFGQNFDYVIVGGGTAGLVLANRLTEQSSVTVAVIEAGTFPEDVVGNRTQVPGYAGYFSISSAGAALEWGFATTPQIVGLTLHTQGRYVVLTKLIAGAQQ